MGMPRAVRGAFGVRVPPITVFGLYATTVEIALVGWLILAGFDGHAVRVTGRGCCYLSPLRWPTKKAASESPVCSCA